MNEKTKRQRYHHCNFRLTDDEFAKLDELAENEGTNRSETVRKLLADITRRLQTEKLGLSACMYRNYSPAPRTRKLDVKIQAQVYDYFKMNCLNLTTALTTSLYGRY